jgi:hypothetical protein
MFFVNSYSKIVGKYGKIKAWNSFWMQESHLPIKKILFADIRVNSMIEKKEV